MLQEGNKGNEGLEREWSAAPIGEAYGRVDEELPQKWVEPFKLKCVMIFDTRSKRESYLRCLRYLLVKKLCLRVRCASVVNFISVAASGSSDK